jgi:putative PIN family toxin of toxin-antitoxin system
MQRIVIDTNVIISSAISTQGNPAKIMDLVLNKKFEVYYSSEIIAEYIRVFAKPRLNFTHEIQEFFINGIKRVGILIDPPASTFPMLDETDRVFYDLAKEVGAIVITGNTKHYPDEDFIMTPSEFLEFINYE